MKREDFEMEKSIQERMVKLDVARNRLIDAWHAVQSSKSKGASVQLAELIHNLIQDKEGELVVDSFVNTYVLKYDEWKRKLEEEFYEL